MSARTNDVTTAKRRFRTAMEWLSLSAVMSEHAPCVLAASFAAGALLSLGSVPRGIADAALRAGTSTAVRAAASAIARAVES